MSRQFPPEVHDFLRKEIPGHTAKQLSAMVAERFGIVMTPENIKQYKNNHHIKSGTPCGLPAGTPSETFPAEIAEYIREHYDGCGPTEMTGKLNDSFGTAYKSSQLKAFYHNHGLCSGITGRFEKGCIPQNKGQKGVHVPGTEKGWFRKGHDPANKMPIGTEWIKTDGYTWIKIGEGCRDWKQKHILTWEAAHGPVPEGHRIIFRDGNRQNCDLSNLALVSLAENIELNRRGYRSELPELTDTGILAARISCMVAEKRRKK